MILIVIRLRPSTAFVFDFSLFNALYIEAKYIKLWDRELNLIYQKLMKKLNNQQTDIFTDFQVGWLQWHTQDTKFVDNVWNNNRKLGSQGSIQELKAQKQRLRNRTLELMEYYYLLGGNVEFEYQGKA